MLALDIGRPLHFRWLEQITLSVFVLNLIDGVLTIYWVQSQSATEANPLMDQLLEVSPLLFMLVKQSLVFLGLVGLWRLRRRRLAVVAIFGVFMVYYLLLLHHLTAFAGLPSTVPLFSGV